MAKKNISGEILEIYGKAEMMDGSELVLCDISWNDRAPRKELRVVKPNGYFGAGFPVDEKTIKNIEKMCKNADFDKDPLDDVVVDFDKIFSKGEKISAMREKYVTKNGKILLKGKK